MRTYGEVIDVRTERVRTQRARTERARTPGRPGPQHGLPADAATGALAAPGPGDLDLGDDCGGTGTDDLEPAQPAQFVWRGRLYLVREVLAHWVELGTWWTARGGAGGSSARRPAPAGTAGTTGTTALPAAEPPDGPPAPRSVAVDVGAVEREVWRVEASVGRAATPGVFDLVRDLPARAPGDPAPPDRWRLARALD